jgi:hypothetical protein
VSSDGYLYLKQRPADLIRIPIAGGVVEHIASGVLQFAVGGGEVLIERQDSQPPSPDGINLYRIQSRGAGPQLIAKVGFTTESMWASSDGRQVGLERRQPYHTQVVTIKTRP